MSATDNDMMDLFVQESSEHLAVLEQDLLTLESTPKDADLLNRIFRAVHSVKGSSGFFGLDRITGLAHAMESVMALVREGQMSVDRPMIDLFLSTADKLKQMIADPLASASFEIEPEVSTLKGLITKKPPEPAAAAKTVEIPEHLKPFNLDPLLFRRALKEGHVIYILKLDIKRDIEDHGRTPLHFLKEIESLGTFFDTYTDISEVHGLEDSAEARLQCVMLFATAMQRDLLVGAFDISHECVEEISGTWVADWLNTQPKIVPAIRNEAPAPVAPQPASQPTATTATAAPAPSPAPVAAASTPPPEAAPQPVQPVAARKPADETIRVNVSVLDDLMNLAGEMVLGRNQLLQVAGTISRQAPGIHSVFQNVNRVTSELQEKVMRTRLQPVGALFGKFPRVVRDLSAKLGKEIELELEGEDVELDRSLIEGLSDPLTHLIRNSADHGIEPPTDRQAKGKPRTGRVKMSAAHVGGRVQIEIADDGRGLDATKLRNKAIEKGLITREEADKLTEKQAQALIFAPGFSTAAQVSDVSGRGVGMDVVKTNIEKLGGSVELDSIVGCSMKVIIRLPLTLAIVPALIIGLGTRRFAIPQVNLEEIVRLGKQHKLEIVRGARVLRLRGHLMPLASLSETLGDAKIGDESNSYVIVLKVENYHFGLIVDRVFDTEEIVVKPISRFLKNTQVYSGCTILGDGHVATILDPAGIASAAEVRFTETKSNAPALDPKDIGETQSLLLFKAGAKETFAMHVFTVGRLEKIKSSDIQRVGEREYIPYNGTSLRLLRLHDFVSVNRSGPDAEVLYVIVPKLVARPMGIVASVIVDTINTNIRVEASNVKGAGMLGSAVLNGNLTVFLDIYNLLESAEPGAGMRPDDGSLAKKRILYAEDTPFFRTVVSRYLSTFVGSIETANDGEDAWKRLNENQYDLLLTDIEMPRLDGFDLSRRVRASDRFKSMPIIALSARDNSAFHERGRAAGIDAYEQKLDKEKLCATLSRVVADRAAGRPTQFLESGKPSTTFIS